MFEIAVCLSSNNFYAQHLGAAVASILKVKNKDEFIKIYIIDGGISEENKKRLMFFELNYDCKIIFVKPDEERLKNCVIYKGAHVSIATFYRCLIPEIIPNESKIIYLDSDTIVRTSLREIFQTDMGENLVYGVADVAEDANKKRLGLDKYVNAGVLLFNCDLMRKENFVDKMFSWMVDNMDKIFAYDQDLINKVAAGRIEYLDDKYNAQVRRVGATRFDNLLEPAILHFISPKKPWSYWKPLNQTPWAFEYFKALEGTPWSAFICEYKFKSMLLYPFRVLYPSGGYGKFLKKIFSIRNSSDTNIKKVTILGFQFKIKRTRFVKKNAL